MLICRDESMKIMLLSRVRGDQKVGWPFRASTRKSKIIEPRSGELPLLRVR